MISGSIYFLGKYRPAYFEAESLDECYWAMVRAIFPITDIRLKTWLTNRLGEGHYRLCQDYNAAWSADHCDRGISFAKRPHDPFMDKAVADMPPCPGLDYSQSLNA